MIFCLATSIKLLLIWAYYSTDFEVHRNWMAITYTLPISRWYFDATSEWTLDYPPFFAYFEYMLSHVAMYFDPAMLKLENLNYASDKTIFFQRMSVIIADITLALGTKMCIKGFGLRDPTRSFVVTCLILGNVGLIFVDHIHFQYNGFLLGFLLLSVGYIAQEKYLMSALMFSILLNLKHIFLYVAPVYVIFLFKHYCLRGRSVLLNFVKLTAVPVMCLIISFGPFADHLPQVFSRLFPFKRGLTHSYWAPNFWALYNFVDKCGSMFLKIKTKTPNTGGLVQEYEHSFLPSISPALTFCLTAVFMIPCVIKLFLLNNRRGHLDFLKAIIICSCTSFTFGWHVHEKAILMVIIPLSILSVINPFDAEMMIFLSTIGHFSLFPLLFKEELIWVKYSLHITYSLGAYLGLKEVHPRLKVKLHHKIYFAGLVFICCYQNILQYLFGFDQKLPFLPLMLTSVYCSVGILYFYCKYYYTFLSTRDVLMKKKKKTK